MPGFEINYAHPTRRRNEYNSGLEGSRVTMPIDPGRLGSPAISHKMYKIKI